MSDYLDRLRDQLVDASRELHGRRRPHWWRRGGAAAAVVVLVGAPALAATGVWRPQIGDGKQPAPKITAEAPPADQLATFGVLRRPQTALDRSAASRAALRLLNGTSIKGVRTNSVRLLAQSPRDRGIVLVPVARYVPVSPELPADTPPEIRKALKRPPIDNALCLFQLDVDGAGVACWSSADVQQGRAWQSLGHRATWILPDGVATVRSEYPGHASIETAVTDNAATFTEPDGRHGSPRITFLDAHGATVKLIEPPKPPPGAITGLPAEHDPVAPGSTHSGAIRRVAISGFGLDARYELLIAQPRTLMMRVILYRPACAGKRRVYDGEQGASGRRTQRIVHPSLGDPKRAQWCPGHYHGYVRESPTGKRLGSFSFRVVA
jgi:hypothetical protein